MTQPTIKLHGLVRPDSAIRRHFIDYKRNAKSRGIPFNIDFAAFSEIVAQDCFYCGQPPSMTAKNTVVKRKYSGVDRRDSREGYTPDNCLPCCKKCNSAKSNYSTEVFLAWAHQLVAHQAAL